MKGENLTCIQLEDAVRGVCAVDDSIGGHDCDWQAIDGLKLISFRVGCARHARQLLEASEEVLQGSSGKLQISCQAACKLTGMYCGSPFSDTLHWQ